MHTITIPAHELRPGDVIVTSVGNFHVDEVQDRPYTYGTAIIARCNDDTSTGIYSEHDKLIIKARV